MPNRLVLPSLAAFALMITGPTLLGLGADIVHGLIGLAVFGGALAVLARGSRREWGWVMRSSPPLIGLVLGSLGLRYVELAAVVAFVLGSTCAVALLAFTRRGVHTKLAFAPTLAAGGFVACVLAWMS